MQNDVYALELVLTRLLRWTILLSGFCLEADALGDVGALVVDCRLVVKEMD